MPPKKKSSSAPTSTSNSKSKTTNGHHFQSGTTTHREEDEWKHNPPYKIHDSPDDFKPVWEGGCHCGKVKYQLSREKPLSAKFCHCSTCQRLHGAPFQWAAIFHKTDINFTHGVHDLGWYDSSAKSLTHHLPCKVSCAYCRTPIMDEGRNMILLFPSLLDDISSKRGKEAFKPGAHMFYGNRVVDFQGDGLDKWTGLDGKSEKLSDEDGTTVVEKWDEEGNRIDGGAGDSSDEKYQDDGEEDKENEEGDQKKSNSKRKRTNNADAAGKGKKKK